MPDDGWCVIQIFSTNKGNERNFLDDQPLVVMVAGSFTNLLTRHALEPSYQKLCFQGKKFAPAPLILPPRDQLHPPVTNSASIFCIRNMLLIHEYSSNIQTPPPNSSASKLRIQTLLRTSSLCFAPPHSALHLHTLLCTCLQTSNSASTLRASPQP
jgi:hypothetical protein